MVQPHRTTKRPCVITRGHGSHSIGHDEHEACRIRASKRSPMGITQVASGLPPNQLVISLRPSISHAQPRAQCSVRPIALQDLENREPPTPRPFICISSTSLLPSARQANRPPNHHSPPSPTPETLSAAMPFLAFAPSAFFGVSARSAVVPATSARRPARANFRMSTEVDEDGYEVPVTRRLSDALKEKDLEARIQAELEARREQEKLEAKMARQRKIDQLNAIPDDLEVGSVNQHMYEAGVQEELAKLDYDLVGLKPVKTRVAEIAALLIVDKMRKSLGLETAVPSLHMSFTGAPGTGKTTVAMRMGQLLNRMGYCQNGHLVVATRDDLVGQYVGHTAPKTKEVIKKAFGGVLLVDEAYYLYNASNEKDYGQESIEILLNVMEHESEDLVVVLAGYEDKMNNFYSYIPGMSSRIGNHIQFPNYSSDELVSIAQFMTRDLQYEFADGASDKFLEYIQKRMEMPYFSNARTVRNAVDRARMRASIRLFNSAMGEGGNGMVSKNDLMTIRPEDLVSAAELAARGDSAIVE